MKKFVAFVVAILLFMFLTVSCFAEEPGPQPPNLTQQVSGMGNSADEMGPQPPN